MFDGLCKKAQASLNCSMAWCRAAWAAAQSRWPRSIQSTAIRLRRMIAGQARWRTARRDSDPKSTFWGND